MPQAEEGQKPAPGREFRERLLKALEGPGVTEKKPNRFTSTINSAFFLWFASAMFVSLWGTYFAGYQQCNKDAEAQTTDYDDLQYEIAHRSRDLRNIILNAKNIPQLRKLAKSIPSVFDRFKNVSLFELYSRSTHIDYLSQGKFTDQAYQVVDLANVAIGAKYFPFLMGDFDIPLDYKNDLAYFKSVEIGIPEANPLSRPVTSFVPNCSPYAVFSHYILGEQTPIIRKIQYSVAAP
jgi:hypothetical protein